MEIFKLFGTIGLNGASEALSDIDDVTEGAENASKGWSKFGDIAKTAAKAAVAVASAAAAGVVALTKSAIEGYADYEQLTGGVETLFKDSANKVMQYANNAYKAAGMSANDYMETVTSFSASLLQGLGGNTAQAADIAHMAIVDMSDNANKMGTDISLIQNAYQGFAKQNYTMLDNLKLGYGGTQTEMIRLINDSGILNETISDLDNVSFDQMIQAIHVVQENMGITGTTAKEASTTIQGSISSMKSAWTNLLVGMADETQDFDQLLTNFIESVGTVASNLLPRIKIALHGIVSLIKGLIPQMAAELPGLVDELLPDVVETITMIIQAIVEILPQLVDTVVAVLPLLIQGILGMLPTIIEAVVLIIVNVVMAVSEMLPTIVTAVIDILPVLIDSLINAIPQLLQAAIVLFMAIVDAIPTIVSELIAVTPTIIEGLISGITGALPSLDGVGASITDKITSPISTAVGWIKEKFETAKNWIVENIGGPIANFYNKWIAPVVNTLIAIVKKLVEIIGALFTGLFNLLKEALTALWNKIVAILSPIFAWVKEKIITPISNAFTSFKNTIVNIATSIWNKIKNVFSPVANWFKTIFQNAYNAITSIFNKIGTFFSGIWSKIKNTFSKLGTSIASAISGAVKSGINGVISMIQNTINGAIGLINGAINLINKLPGVSVSKISTLSLPRLAKGNVAYEETPAVFGEYVGARHNPEITAPQSVLKETFKAVLDEQKPAATADNSVLITKFDEMIDALKSMRVYLDSGAMVGELAPQMDNALGNIGRMKVRGT